MSKAVEESMEEKLQCGIQVQLRNGLIVMIRKLKLTDGERFYRFMCNLSPYSRSMFHPHPFNRQSAERTALEAESQNGFRLVALYGDEIIAYACWVHRLFRSHFPIVSIAVADAFQNQGLGRRLMELLIEIAKKKEKFGLELDVYKENANAIHLYESLGFRKIGETSDKRQYIMRLEFEDKARSKQSRRQKTWLKFWKWGRS